MFLFRVKMVRNIHWDLHQLAYWSSREIKKLDYFYGNKTIFYAYSQMNILLPFKCNMIHGVAIRSFDYSHSNIWGTTANSEEHKWAGDCVDNMNKNLQNFVASSSG